jgi:hypothetical protein
MRSQRHTSPPPQQRHPTNVLILRFLKRNPAGATITQIQDAMAPLSESGVRESLYRMRANWGLVEQVIPASSKERIWKFVKDMDDPANEAQQIAHGEGCWAWGPSHFTCACAEIARLRGLMG